MSVERLRQALDAFDEPAACQGSHRLAGPLAIVLPDGEIGVADEPGFVAWLQAHAEAAPYGQGGETKLDGSVRNALRLVARGTAQVAGFDPAAVLGEIEAALSPRSQLIATLTDVLVYPVGGHFAPHRDTPLSSDLVGTLIVGLPIEHTGGGFEIDDGDEPRILEWGGPVDPTLVRWVALYGDVDHAVHPVTHGSRVTLVYALTLTDRFRDDPAWQARVRALDAAARLLELPPGGPLMIACSRHVIGIDGEQPLGLDALRGADRDLARVLASRGFAVAVRTCVVAREHDAFERPSTWFRPAGELYFARLARPLLEADLAALVDCVVFENPWGGDGGGYMDDEFTTLEPYILDTVPADRWILRRRAATTFLREVDFAGDGYLGNGAVESYLYKLAALEITRRAP